MVDIVPAGDLGKALMKNYVIKLNCIESLDEFSKKYFKCQTFTVRYTPENFQKPENLFADFW
jgi:hypothetical protein